MRLIATGRPPLVLCVTGEIPLHEFRREFSVRGCVRIFGFNGLEDKDTVDPPALEAVAKGSRAKATLESERAPVELEGGRHPLVEIG